MFSPSSLMYLPEAVHPLPVEEGEPRTWNSTGHYYKSLLVLNFLTVVSCIGTIYPSLR